nr:pyridoxamine 5'-phosphate oxidase family protein [Erythrobacter ani]
MVDVDQSFGNCPQYIHERKWRRAERTALGKAVHSSALSEAQSALIRGADTMFIGTGQSQRGDHPSNGFDASHRGGEPGFVAVSDAGHLRIPDYAGNNFFNTIGNLLENPRIGLVFVDFGTGGLLHVSGTAQVDWSASESHDPGALRMIDVTIDAVVERPGALSLRWSKDDSDLRQLVVIDKVRESEDITSFHLAPADGAALPAFKAGQHLPVELNIPGQPGRVRRSYSLSGSPDSGTYRLSIKREAKGMASRFMHDVLHEGGRVDARHPSGDFVIPCSNCPLVLVSAGVGLTPMLSMLHDAARSTERPVWYVHGARNGRSHALRAEAARLSKTSPKLKVMTLYTQPDSADILGEHYDARGRVTVRTLLELNAGEGAHYMICGPAAFLADIRSGLEAAGVPESQIHFETFGPTG